MEKITEEQQFKEKKKKIYTRSKDWEIQKEFCKLAVCNHLSRRHSLPVKLIPFTLKQREFTETLFSSYLGLLLSSFK